MSISKKQMDKVMARMRDPEYMRSFLAKEQAKTDKENFQADRLYNLVKDDFDSFIEKLDKKKIEYRSRNYIHYRLFNYARRHGTPIDLKEDWPTDSFILNGWVISITFGQGSFIWIKKHECTS